MMVLVSRRRQWLVLGVTGPIEGGTGRYMMVLGQDIEVASVIELSEASGRVAAGLFMTGGSL